MAELEVGTVAQVVASPCINGSLTCDRLPHLPFCLILCKETYSEWSTDFDHILHGAERDVGHI